MSRISNRLAAAILGLMVLLCYLSSLNGTFHFDDTHSIESNRAVHSISSIPNLWIDPSTSSFIPENRVYRPLTYTFYTICWFVGGGSTWSFHLLKILFHFLVVLAVFLIWQYFWQIPGWFPDQKLESDKQASSRVIRLNPSTVALLLAALFAVHPACSECVDYISATTSLQCAMFYVWAFYFYLLFGETQSGKYLWISLFLYFCSVASKEEGITLVGMVFLTEIYIRSSQRWVDKLRSTVLKLLPYFGLAILLGIWLYGMHPTEGNESRGSVSSFQYFITQWRAYLHYMRIWFWPFGLNADSATWQFSKGLLEPTVIISGILNLLIFGLSWIIRKAIPALFFGVLWFYITISPASSVVVLAEAVNEHRMYLAYVGFVGGVFSAVLYAHKRVTVPDFVSRWMSTFCIVLFGSLFIGTQVRNRVWANDENLWLDTVNKNPTSGRALNNLAIVYLNRGEYEKANRYLLECEKFWKGYMYCPLNLGNSFLELSKKAEMDEKIQDFRDYSKRADESYHRAYLLNPRSVHTNFNLGRLYQELQKDCSKAIPYFLKSIEITGGRYPAAEAHIAQCYQELGRTQEAYDILNRAYDLEPNSEQVLLIKGMMEFKNNQSNVALATFHELLQLYPSDSEGWHNVASIAQKRGDFNLAVYATKQLIFLDPNDEVLRNQLKELQSKGRIE